MEETVEERVVDLIRSEGIQDGLANLAEAGIDQLLESGFLQDVPVLGSVLGVIRATGAVRNLLLAKKLGLFLRELQSVPQDERQAFCDSLKEQDERRKVGEGLLLLLDRLDDMDKPEIVARLFRAFLRGEIDRETFHLMATAVDRLFIPHLASLLSFYSGDQPERRPSLDVCQALALTGLLRVEARGDGGGMMGPEFAGATIHYERNEFGQTFVRLIG